MAETTKEMEDYFKKVEEEVNKSYSIANEAKSKGYDPEEEVKIPLAKTMAERVEGLISTVAPQIKRSGIVERIAELEKIYGAQDWRVAFKIAEEVAQQKFCKFKDEKEAIEIAIRVGFAYVTVGVVASPLEGFVELKINKTKDGKDYFCLMYSGPVRSAGGTGASVSVLIADYLRKKFGYAAYDPTEKEIKRTFTELSDYHEKITNLQYFPSEEEVEFLTSHLPVQISGDPSEKFEVSNYKDLPRIETNKLRNGFCLVTAECLSLKAPKIWKQLSKWGKDFDMGHWSFLEEFIALQKKIKAKSQENAVKEEKITPDYTFIKDIVAGRPVITHPLRNGGLRLRYGRTRTSGFSSDAIHPATMIVLDSYIAIGTQLKTERPGKSTVLATCDSIDGPIVKLTNGSVVRLDTEEDAKKYYKELKEIIYLGDVLINYGDFLNRAHKLIPCGFNEEWWFQCLKKDEAGAIKIIGEQTYSALKKNSAKTKISVALAKKISDELKIPLHPRWIYFWNTLTIEQLNQLFSCLKEKAAEEEGKIIIPIGEDKAKRALELIGVPHKVVTNEYIVIEKEDAQALLLNIGELTNLPSDGSNEKKPLELINELSSCKIKDKLGIFIGARMGRPEKAKMRELTGSPHVLFPVGDEGGRLRCFQSALEKGKITARFPTNFCEECKIKTIYKFCEVCGKKTKKQYYCRECNSESDEKCEKHPKSENQKQQTINIQHYLDAALKKLKDRNYPTLIKGVRGLMSRENIPENLAKGILRAKHKIYVNKDGTTRYDMTEMACTHFKPKEIGTSVEKLKSLGYLKDCYGDELADEDQVLELKPQDVILPACRESLDEGADEVLFRCAQFMDDLLEKFYGIKPFYNLKTKEDIVGQLLVALSPHTSAGMVTRVIGFSRTQGFFAHPLLHSILRRDCFSYDTFIPIMHGGIWKNIKIGELVEELNLTKQVDLFGTLAKKVSGYYTLGINNKGKVDVVKVNDFTKHKPSKILQIKTNDGRVLRVTETHKFLIFENNKIKRVAASDLFAGSKLVVPLQNPIKSEDLKFIDLKNHFSSRNDVMIRNVKEFIEGVIKQFENIPSLRRALNLPKNALYNFLSRDSLPLPLFFILLSLSKTQKAPKTPFLAAKRDTVNIPDKIPLSEAVLYLIGFYVAEGYARKKVSKKGFYQIGFAVRENELREKVLTTMKENFNLTPSTITSDAIVYSSKITYDFFVDILKCGRNAHEKRIPSIILTLPKEKLNFFLQGYYDGDGSVSRDTCRVSCDSVSEGLLHDLEFALRKYGLFTKRYYYKKIPGPHVREFYIRKKREVPEFGITKLTIPSNYVNLFYEQIGFSLGRKQEILEYLACSKKITGMRIQQDKQCAYPSITEIKEDGFETTYCLNVDNHTVMANGFLVGQCDGDEAAVMLLLDCLINFSKNFLPSTRGATQDEPLVLTSRLIATEVDDMVFDMDVAWEYPLELYEASENYAQPWDIKIDKLRNFLGTEKQYEGMGFTHNTTNINDGVRCSAYKSIPTMQEKVIGQMAIAEKIRAVEEHEVARLVIERHFIRDIKGNLRKFSMQQFRCVDCNEKFRRPPLSERCTKCQGKIIFTISEGSIIKYLEPAISLAEKYHLPPYLKQTLFLTRDMIESVFGKESERQEGLGKWFSS
ncbi:DNA polymerase II large subunit [Candidatus Woesearchaeota archaeon]|nr:DNA polymerase II large subunit [Candidatus Woesearchaeota archaeon]